MNEKFDELDHGSLTKILTPLFFRFFNWIIFVQLTKRLLFEAGVSCFEQADTKSIDIVENIIARYFTFTNYHPRLLRTYLSVTWKHHAYGYYECPLLLR